MSKHIPILFSGPMVRAILEGRKSQTRRILKPQLVCTSHAAWPDNPEPVPSIDGDGVHCAICGAGVSLNYRHKSGVQGIPVRFSIGDRLWVREAWRCNGWATDVATIFYRANERDGYTAMCEQYPVADRKPLRVTGTWRPGIHLPRWASRLTLYVASVKIERLQDINDDDCRAEGVLAWRASWSEKQAAEMFLRGTEAAVETREGSTPQRLFYLLWRSLHGADSWRANPFVVAVTFRAIKANVDLAGATVAA